MDNISSVHPHLHWINLIILFGGLQGLAFSLVLLFNKKHPGSKFLSALIFVLAYNSIETFNWSSGLNLIFFGQYPFVFIFGIGPSLYLYFHSILFPELRFTRTRVVMHYAPVIFQFIFCSALIIYGAAAKKFILTPIIPLGNLAYWHAFISEPLSVLFFVSYLVMSIRLYRSFFNAREFKHTDYNQQVRAWGRALLLVMTCLGVLWPLTVLTPYLIDIPFDAHYYPIEIMLVFAIYWIAMRGYHKTQVIYRKQNSMSVSDVKADEVMSHLTRVMLIDQLYLEPELTLTKITSHTGIPAKTISAVINQMTGKSFNDFINRYRVEKVKERLADPASARLTITGIALECGFNSQATFQRAFKQHTGMSPSEYINSQPKS